MTSAIRVSGLHYRYRDDPVLVDLGFRIPTGSFFIIIGPNGSGKTTTMKVIAGTEKPRSGRIEILGKAMQRYSRKEMARHIAYVPQLVLEDLPFTVMEVVLMGRSPHLGMLGLDRDADREIARRAMAFTGVSHLAGRKLDSISGGERQRVFIARAICQEPQVMLLDEPTAALDLANQVRIMDLMEQLRDEKGVTVVMVSHDINLAAMYGDQLLLLKEGRIVSEGPPAEVLNYRTLETAYGCTLLVDRSPLGNFPRVTLVPRRLNIVDGGKPPGG